MYCPRCSQSSEDLRFCPGCGLPLGFVHELLANNGAPTSSQIMPAQSVPLMRRKGFRAGAKLMFLSFFLVPVAIMGSIVFDSPGPLIVPTLVFLIGVATALYTLLFVEPGNSPEAKRQLGSMNHHVGLPLTKSPPITLAPGRINTSEMARPVSVTEHTTQLLDENR